MISTLDTHELVKDLKASGFTDAQAEAVTRAVKQSQDFSDLVTKSDLALLRGEIRGEIGELRSEIGEVRTELREEMSKVRVELGNLRAEIVALELRPIKWAIGVGITATLAIGGMFWTVAQVLLRTPPHL